MNPFAHLDAVTVRLRRRTIFDGATMAFERGAISAVIGPNGSGKSVLFRLLAGFIRPTSGSVSIAADFLEKGRDYPARLGLLIDRPGYIGSRTGLQNLLDLASIRGEIDEVGVRDALRRVGLDADLKQKVRHYSLGMKQKLGIAQAIMEHPDVLLLDEPFNALDSDSVRRIRELVVALNTNGTTVLFTSHNSEDVQLLAHKVIEIRSGQLVDHDASASATSGNP